MPLPKYLHVQCRIHKVHILLIQLFPKQLYRFANTGNMKYRKGATNTCYWVTASYRQYPSILMKL